MGLTATRDLPRPDGRGSPGAEVGSPGWGHSRLPRPDGRGSPGAEVGSPGWDHSRLPRPDGRSSPGAGVGSPGWDHSHLPRPDGRGSPGAEIGSPGWDHSHLPRPDGRGSLGALTHFRRSRLDWGRGARGTIRGGLPCRRQRSCPSSSRPGRRGSVLRCRHRGRGPRRRWPSWSGGLSPIDRARGRSCGSGCRS